MSLRKLIDNYHSYSASLSPAEKELYASLGQSQNPSVALITCCDSRMPIAKLLGSNAGDLFVIRNVANIVPPYNPNGSYHETSAALEFATKHLQVKDIVVKGHSNCGGIKATLANPSTDQCIEEWLALIRPHLLETHTEGCPNEHVDATAKKNVLLSLERLRSYPWINSALEKGDLRLSAWFFNITDAQLYQHTTRGWEKL